MVAAAGFIGNSSGHPFADQTRTDVPFGARAHDVQYAWPHPSRKYFYVAWSDGGASYAAS